MIESRRNWTMRTHRFSLVCYSKIFLPRGYKAQFENQLLHKNGNTMRRMLLKKHTKSQVSEQCNHVGESRPQVFNALKVASRQENTDLENINFCFTRLLTSSCRRKPV